MTFCFKLVLPWIRPCLAHPTNIYIYVNFQIGTFCGTNSICTDFNFQYTSLKTQNKNLLRDYILSQSMLTYTEIAVKVKEAIGRILTNNSPDPSDEAILTNFYNNEISPGTSSTMCIVTYVLG